MGPSWTLAVLATGVVGVGGVGPSVHRRQLLRVAHSTALASALAGLQLRPAPCGANGLVFFPPEQLNNRYFLLRAGETRAEASGRIEANPIATLGPTSYLTPTGVEQVKSAAKALEGAGLAGGAGCWVYYNKAAPSQQSALVLQRELGISTSNMVPDFAWLDPRGVGAFEGKGVSVLDDVRRMDATDPLQRPPPGDDGTPSESAGDLLVRTRNIVSIIETSYTGADVVLVSPSSDVLSVLRAAALGEDLREHTRFSLGQGEFAELKLRPRPQADEAAAAQQGLPLEDALRNLPPATS